MIDKYFRCFSGKLKNFLLERGSNYILKANDCLTHRTFWLFEKDKCLDENLKLWNETNPKLMG